MSVTVEEQAPQEHRRPTEKPVVRLRGKNRKMGSTLTARGEPMIWLTGGCLVMCLVMILGLLGLVFYNGVGTFWPKPLIELKTLDGKVFLGKVTKRQVYTPSATELDSIPQDVRTQAEARLAELGGTSPRRLLRTANFDLTGTHFNWVSEYMVTEERTSDWALFIERDNRGHFYGYPKAFTLDGERRATEPAEIWALYQEHHEGVLERVEEIHALEEGDTKTVARKREAARIAVRAAELEHGKDSPEHQRAEQELQQINDWAVKENKRIAEEIAALKAENDRFQLEMETADGKGKTLGLAEIIRAFPSNRLSFGGKVGVYLSRWWEFLSANPREANSEGGVFPAIFGTAVMTILMSLAVVPFGVMAALYLREYAKAGWIVSIVRIAINNLAGVPSIVFGVFGLGFFCYVVGGYIDGGPKNAGFSPLPSKQWFLLLAAFAGLVVLGVTGMVLNRGGTKTSGSGASRVVNLLIGLPIVAVWLGVLVLIGDWFVAIRSAADVMIRVAGLGVLAGMAWVVFKSIWRAENDMRTPLERAVYVGGVCTCILASLLAVGLVALTPFFDGFYEARLPNPTFGKSAMLWASFTLALLTLPVVIVATEEALSAVPNSMREGSYACGASKWQTIKRIVLPRATPGIMTGMILAMARGAGEVAPLMLVGAVKIAPELPFDTAPPFGLNRSFMHLGFHIYDVGFQSQNSEAGKPLVYTTTLLLITLILLLSMTSIWLRSRLRKKFVSTKF
jgi:ABC-type phosphate transport system permease subunit